MSSFLRLWVGSTYAVHAIPLAEVLVAAQFIRLTMLPYAIVGLSVGQQQRMLVSPFAEGVINLIFSVILVQKFGAIGVALGTLVGAILGVALHFLNSMPRTDAILVSRRALILQDIARPILLAFPVVVLLSIARISGLNEGLYLTITGAGDLAVAAVLFRYLLAKQEQEEIVDFCRHIGISISRRLAFSR
jgi:O-antigen/teichoic acid export membrane protein